jgi:FkbM family methyltransferase
VRDLKWDTTDERLLSSYLYRVRDRLHPLNHLRRHAFTRAILQAIDVPVWAGLPGVRWNVRVRLIRHACYFVLSAGAEPGVASLVCSIVRQCGVRSFWDVGANIGYYSWLVKSIAPTAQIRMFEPEPDNLLLIRSTIRRNSMLGVTVRGVAASDTHGTCCFSRDWISGSTGSVLQNDSYSERAWRVAPRAVTATTVLLDDERRAAGITDLVKIDVEGHEEAVIRGALETIRSDQPILIIECFHRGNEMITALQPLNYVFLDAERMTSVLPATSNFLALPKRYHAVAGELRRTKDKRGLVQT